MRTLEHVKEPKSQNSCVFIQEKEGKNEENPHKKGEEIIPDGLMREVPIGKGLYGALKRLRDQGCLKETEELSDPKKGSKTSKLGGIYDDLGEREIIIERRDEFGNIMNEKEAFRQLCYKFHGKRPGKNKQEKRMRKIEQEKNAKQLSKNSEESMVLMDNALKALQKPYLVVDGKRGDMKNSFAAVAECLPVTLHEGKWPDNQDAASFKRTTTCKRP